MIKEAEAKIEQKKEFQRKNLNAAGSEKFKNIIGGVMAITLDNTL